MSAEGANPPKRKKISAEGTNRSKETKELQQKEQTARKRLEDFSRRSKPLEGD